MHEPLISKECTKCLHIKPILEFTKGQYNCKQCRQEYYKEHTSKIQCPICGKLVVDYYINNCKHRRIGSSRRSKALVF
jgi:Zn finger protein HypA/HybF involved in hydrogenase expression